MRVVLTNYATMWLSENIEDYESRGVGMRCGGVPP